MRLHPSLPVAALLVWALPALPATAADPSQATIQAELNKLEDHDDSCRVYLVFTNSGAETFSEFKLDIFIFGPDQVVAKRLLLDAAPLRPRKTTVKVFDVSGLTCQGVGSILLNDVTGCRSGPNESLPDCIDRITAASKVHAALRS
jgi:hypothetical protein